MNIYSFDDATAMEDFARHLAKQIKPPLMVWLIGDLGSGKTVFVSGCIHGLGWNGLVKSPTYTLVEVYATPKCTVCHFDLYRLSDAVELETMGIRDYFATDNVCLIEWADRMQEALLPADLILHFSYTDTGRQVIADACSEAGRVLLEQA